MLFTATALLAILPFVAGQTSTSCNPTNTTCPADPGYDVATTTYNFQTSGLNSDWIVLGSGDKISQDSSGLKFTIDADGQAPTLTSAKYLFFGRVTAVLEAAPGAGIVSAFILQSDDLDEIDWEWLGGDTAHVQSNYFSKGDTSSYDRGATHNVATPQTTFHTYVIDWSPTQVEWIIDGVVVRTLTAASVGSAYPQTPSQVRIGSWCGGCTGEPAGTVQWAGGPTTFGSAPYIMTIQSLTIENTNPAESYVYSDKTGNASSIKTGGAVPLGNSTVSIGSDSSTASATSKASSSASASHSASASVRSVSASGTHSAVVTTGGSTPVVTVGTSTPGTTSSPSGTLGTSSSATKLSLGGIATLVFGAVILMMA